MKTLEIETKNGIYYYKEAIFTFEKGAKEIDVSISKTNLLDLKKCLDQHDLQFGLIYGTLLGAIRENNFIEHDHDTDVFVFNSMRDDLISLLFELRELGFEVGRYSDVLLSIVRNGEYIDIYFFNKSLGNKYECDGYVIPKHFLDNLKEYDFLGTKFNVPKQSEELLVYLYGKDWKIPKKGVSPTHYGLYLRIREFIKANFKTTFKIISWIKRRINV